MASKLPWFRVYSEILDDKKIKRICRATGYDKATVIGIWVCLLAIANDSTDRGRLQISSGIPYDINDLAYETGIPDDRLDSILRIFGDYDMLHYDSREGWSITNWSGRQFKSDNVAERVAKHRANKASKTVKRFSNVIDIDLDTDIDTDSDTEVNNDTDPDDPADQFARVWESETGSLVSSMTQFDQMIREFQAAGVTPEIYRTAIREQKASSYPVNRPTSVKSWALSLVTKKNTKPTTSETNETILQEMINNGEI